MSNTKTSHLTHSLLAGACLALCSAAAQAATPTQADLDSIVLYGSTTIAQDSTSAWGIWDTLEPTASGPQLPRVDNFVKADLYRPLAQFTLAAATPAVANDAICSAGSICGFGLFLDAYTVSEERAQAAALVGNDSVAAVPVEPLSRAVHSYALTGTEVALPKPPVVLEQASAVADTIAPQAVVLLNQVLKDGTFELPNSGTLRLNGSGYDSASDSGDSFHIEVDSERNWYFNPIAKQVTWYTGYLNRYVSGGGTTHQDFAGAGGITTPLADMSELRASGMTASYAGYDRHGGTVQMTVDFGAGTVTSGNFNGGADSGKVGVRNTAAGPALYGQVGLAFTGTINGVNFKSTSVSATDGSVQGSVTGAFFGTSAGAAAGVADITKTRTDGTYKDARFVSPFIVIKDLDISPK